MVAAYFLDTSTIVKRYAQEIGTAWVQALTAPAGGHLLAVVRVAQADGYGEQWPGATWPDWPNGLVW
jgi:hypothetical protein